MEIILNIFIFLFGLCVGSFLNVCIYRIPEGESVVFPRSRCRECKHTIPWYDNIPLMSFILLGRKCRFCKAKISSQYFTVELLTGLLFLTLFVFYGTSLKFFIYSVLFSGLVIVTFIDMKYKEIPDRLNVPGIFIGIALSFAFPSLHGASSNVAGLVSSLEGALAGGGSIYALGVLGYIIFKKEAMGFGDVKLMAMIGAFIGWKFAILTFFLAPFFGSVVGIWLKIKTGDSLIPYGPFLSLASLVALLWGNRIFGYLFAGYVW